jgi:hypothetical protein
MQLRSTFLFLLLAHIINSPDFAKAGTVDIAFSAGVTPADPGAFCL